MSATTSGQMELTDYLEDDSPDFSDMTPDGRWGPTMDTDIPEQPVLPGGVDERELPDTGLAPSDFEILNGQVSASIAREKGFHPDDQHRPKRWQKELETPGFRDALENQHKP